jgi:hypothetical protein
VCCSGFATCAAALQHSMLHQDPRRSAGTADRERTWAVACLFVCLFVCKFARDRRSASASSWARPCR